MGNGPISRGHNVFLFFEDVHLDPAAAASAYQKLKTFNKIDAVMLFGSQSAHAVVPLAERDQVISLVITTDPSSVSNTTYAVRLALDADSQADALGSYLRSHGIEKVALIGTTQEAMLGYLNTFENKAKNFSLTVVSKQDFQKGETDFRAALDRTKSLKVDTVVISLLPGSLSTFFRQYRQRFPQGRAFGFAQTENLAEIEAAQGTMDGVIFSSVHISKEFKTLYRKTYGEEPQSYAAYSYDLLRMLKENYFQKDVRPDAVVVQIRTLENFDGACGHYSAGPDFNFHLATELIKIHNGAFEAEE